MGIAHKQSPRAQDSKPVKHVAWAPSPPQSPCGLQSSSRVSATGIGSHIPHSPSPPPTYYGGRIIPLPAVSPRNQAKELEDCAGVASMSPPAKNTRLASLDVAPLLSRAPKGDRIRLKWDMACDGLQSYDRSLKTHIASSVCLGDPALSTPTPSLIITIAGAPYPYTIRVDRSPLPTAPPFVTVRDVLQAVHAHLGETITPQEMQSAATQTDVWNAALATWRHRTNGDAMRRMRRIDFLGGRTVFFGLASAGPARVLGKSELPRLELLVGKRES